MRKSTKITAVVGGTALTLATAGIAYAAWSSSGSGSGTAQSTTSTDSVIAAGTSAADLYPGATKSVTVTISNPNPYPVLVTSISGGSSVLVNSTCAAGSVTSDAKALNAAGLVQSDNSTKTIAPSGSGTYTLVTHMIADPDNACKAQSFSLALTSTLVSNAS
ncbi:MAG: hypothetical protein JWO27_1145 [Frankiales bacterium]|nr:hypothetical protein [Frankiales bacterium]